MVAAGYFNLNYCNLNLQQVFNMKMLTLPMFQLMAVFTTSANDSSILVALLLQTLKQMQM